VQHFSKTESVCTFENFWCSISNPKCHVMFSKTKINVNWHLHFLLSCHLIVICLVVHVLSISKVSIDLWFFLHKSHYMSNFEQSIQFLFLCASCYVWNVKNLQLFMSKIHTRWSRGNHEECKLLHNFIPCEQLVTFSEEASKSKSPTCIIKSP